MELLFLTFIIIVLLQILDIGWPRGIVWSRLWADVRSFSDFGACPCYGFFYYQLSEIGMHIQRESREAVFLFPLLVLGFLY